MKRTQINSIPIVIIQKIVLNIQKINQCIAEVAPMQLVYCCILNKSINKKTLLLEKGFENWFESIFFYVYGSILLELLANYLFNIQYIQLKFRRTLWTFCFCLPIEKKFLRENHVENISNHANGNLWNFMNLFCITSKIFMSYFEDNWPWVFTSFVGHQNMDGNS